MCAIVSWALYFRVSLMFAVKVWAKAGVPAEGSVEKESTSKLTHVVVGGIQFLEGSWAEGLSSLTVMGPLSMVIW